MHSGNRMVPPVLEVYGRHARAWAALRNVEIVETAWLDRFVAHIRIGGSVLDIGCGTGKPIGAELVRRGFQLSAIDGSPSMLSLLRENLPGVTAQLADMRQLALGIRFEGLIAWDSFFHLSPADQRPMFDRFAAHAAPGAPLLFTSGTEEGSAIGELEGTPLYHGSLSTTEYRTLLEGAGFTILAHVVADPSCGSRTVWLAKQRE